MVYSLPMFGLSEILVIASIGVLFFGAKNIPKIASSLGDTVRSFKKGLNEEDEKPVRDVEEIKKKP